MPIFKSKEEVSRLMVKKQLLKDAFWAGASRKPLRTDDGRNAKLTAFMAKQKFENIWGVRVPTKAKQKILED